MSVPRLILASVVGLAVISSAFEHMVGGIGSGPGGEPPNAFANEGGSGGGGDREIFLNPPPGYNPPPSQPAPQPRAPATTPPAPVKTPEQRLQEVNAEIATVEGAIIEKNGEIAKIEAKIARVAAAGNLGARDPELEARLDRKKRQRTELATRLNRLYQERTRLISSIVLRVVTAPPR